MCVLGGRIGIYRCIIIQMFFFPNTAMTLTCNCSLSCNGRDFCEGKEIKCYVMASVHLRDGHVRYDNGCLPKTGSSDRCNSRNTFTGILPGYVSRFNCCTTGDSCNRELTVAPPLLSRTEYSTPTSSSTASSTKDNPIISVQWTICLVVFAAAVVVILALLIGLVLEVLYYRHKTMQRRCQSQQNSVSLASTDMTLSTQLSSSLTPTMPHTKEMYP